MNQKPIIDRHILVQDNDSHWYVISAWREPEWTKWLNLDSDDEKSWDAPDFAKEVNGSPSRVKFERYEIE